MDPWAAAAAPPLQPPPSSPSTNSTSTTTTATTNYPNSPINTGSDQSVPLIGKYRLDKYLGRGSFAKVFRGRDINDGKAVAIKIMDKSKIDTFMEPRILREVAAMRRLNHPHILRIHEVMATKSKIFLVMELAKGGDLFEKLASRPGHRFPEQIARRYFQQLISALHYCHQNGVAHRDMKPQNILLDKEGNLKVCDFGLSAVSDQQVRNGLLHTACGTPAFSAPEVIGRRGYDGPKADAWSCGVILFVMLSGFLPFEDGNLPAMYRKMFKREIRFPSWLSKSAKCLIHQLLDPNPKTRLSIESIMQSPWMKVDQLRYNKCLSLGDMVSINERKFERAPSMNAFDIINMSSGLDLSGLFEGDDDSGSTADEGSSKGKKEKRFTTKESVEKVVEKVVEVGGNLGYEVEKGKDSGKIWLGKGKLLLIVEALEVAEELVIVEIRVVDGGGVVFEDQQWGELKSGLGDIVSSWQLDDRT